MTIQKQIVPISFAQGIDTKSDPKQVVAGKMLRLENAVFGSTGRVKKRNGYRALAKDIMGVPQSTSGELSSGESIGTFKAELFLGTGSEGYGWSAAGWVDKGLCEALSVGARPVVRNNYQQTSPDLAVHQASGLSLCAWEDSAGGVKYSIYDTDTGQPVVVNAVASATASRPKTMTLGPYLVVLYYDAGNIKAIPIPVVTPSNPGATVTVASNASATFQAYDASVVGSKLMVAYANNTPDVSVVSIDIRMSVSAESVIADLPGYAIAVWGDTSNNVWVAYAAGSEQVVLTVYDYSLAHVLLAPTFVDSPGAERTVRVLTGICVESGSATIFYEPSAATVNQVQVLTAQVSLSGTVFGTGIYARSVGLASKPWHLNDAIHLLVTHESPLQSTYFVMTDGSVVGKLSQGTGGGLVTSSVLPEVNLMPAEIARTAYLQADQLESRSGTIYTQTGIMEGTFDFSHRQTELELSDNLHLTGGILWMFDGAQVCEHGFHLYPEGLTTNVTPFGGHVTAGQHQYCAVYEWMDNYGCLHRSAPSVPVTTTVAAGSISVVTLTIPTLRLTTKNTAVSIVVYGTEAAGTIFYRLTSIASPLRNDTTVDIVTFDVTEADASIIGNAQLYTTGGELENISAPATDLVTSYRNRLVLVPAENPLTFWYSKQVIQGSPVEFNDALYMTMDRRGGDITAVAPLDDKLIVFKSDHIFYVLGDGPAPDGSANDLVSYLATTDSGCSAPASVVAIPSGLMFQSSKGIQLLDRSLGVQYIGAPVEAYNSSTVTSAVLMPSSRQVRFTLDSGVALIYDYLYNQWSVSTGVSATAACVWQGKHVYLRTTGQVMEETPGVYTDDGDFIRLSATTSWLSFAGLQGYQRTCRLLVLGEYVSPHLLGVGIAYDFDPEVSQQIQVDAGTLLTGEVYGHGVYGIDTPYGGEYPLYQFRVHLERQKCQSIQVTIQDSQASAYGEGFSLSALALEVGVKVGLNRKSATRSFG